jgi:poly(A) polymerase
MRTFGIGPQSEIGVIKSQIKESILEGIISNNYEDAVKEMIRIGNELGLTVKIAPDLEN